MAPRTWVTSICLALGVAVGAGAAQLGVGYGLSVISWVPAAEDSSRSIWLGSLAWVAWLAANSTIFGALVAHWLTERNLDPDRSQAFDIAWRTVISLAAAVGALVVVPLVAVPARYAQQANNSAPQYTAGGYAVVGVVIGLVVAIGAVNVRAIATNVLATAAWLWVLAAAAVTHGLQIGAEVGSAQLATWQFKGSHWVRGMINLPGALLMLGAAVAIGVAAAWFPGRRGDRKVGVAISGAVGPTLVAAAYFLAIPGLGNRDQQLSACVTAPYAVIAGLAGSVLVAALGSKEAREQARLKREAKEAAEHDSWSRTMSGTDDTTSRTKSPKTRSESSRLGRRDRGSTASGAKEDGLSTRAGLASKWSSLIPRRGRNKDAAKDGAADPSTAYASAKSYLADSDESEPARRRSGTADRKRAGR